MKKPKIEDAGKAKEFSDQAADIAGQAATVLAAAEQLAIKHKPLEHFWLSPAQRDVLLSVPSVSKRFKSRLAETRSFFTIAEVSGMATALAEELPKSKGKKQFALLLVVKHLLERLRDEVTGLIKVETAKSKKPKTKIPAGAVFQFKITLQGIEPPIWRRIQTKDCTLDKLHEHIQTAMGWTNSHLHQFKIDGVPYGDPQLFSEGMEGDTPPLNSLRTKLSKIIPWDGKRFQFEYEYDFGDGWEHEILFEGFPSAEKSARYPLCVEGERACPPDDVGGTCGYQDYVKAMVNPKHKRHKEFLEWNGPFDPEKFDAQAATKEMRKGVPDWRNKAGI
jgi:hypothetical protein